MKYNREYTSLECLINNPSWDFIKWDFRFLKLAKEVSTWSKDPSTKVGAVSTDGYNHVCGLGYNGFPSTMCDDMALLSNRDTKLLYTLHAEENCLFNSSDTIRNIYTYPFPPCARCALKIVQYGIINVISVDGWPERWDESIQQAFEIFRLNNTNRIIYDREEFEKLCLEQQ